MGQDQWSSDSFLIEHLEGHDLIEVRYRSKRSWQEKLSLAAEMAVERGVRRLLKSERDQQFL